MLPNVFKKFLILDSLKVIFEDSTEICIKKYPLYILNLYNFYIYIMNGTVSKLNKKFCL